MTTKHLALLLLLGVAGLLPIACDDDHDREGVPTESVCPTTQTLTYANFGRAFFDSYCQRCHAGTVTGAARMGAPADHTFDQIQDIQLLSEHIDEHAAAGPAGVNTEMPPGAPLPTEAERRQLGEWLACGAPQ
jgi:cytochrome c5